MEFKLPQVPSFQDWFWKSREGAELKARFHAERAERAKELHAERIELEQQRDEEGDKIVPLIQKAEAKAAKANRAAIEATNELRRLKTKAASDAHVFFHRLGKIERELTDLGNPQCQAFVAEIEQEMALMNRNLPISSNSRMMDRGKFEEMAIVETTAPSMRRRASALAAARRKASELPLHCEPADIDGELDRLRASIPAVKMEAVG